MFVVSVFAGSKKGKNNAFVPEVRELGKMLAKQSNIQVQIGGYDYGLMNEFCESAFDVLKDTNRKIKTIVVPQYKEPEHDLVDQVVADNLSDRNKLFLDSHLAIVLPAGDGGVAEFDQYIYEQQGKFYDQKEFNKTYILNVAGYYDWLEARFKSQAEHEMAKADFAENAYVVEKTAVELMNKICLDHKLSS